MLGGLSSPPALILHLLTPAALDQAGGSSLSSKWPVKVALDRELCGEERKGGGLQPPRQPWEPAFPGHGGLLREGCLPQT